MKKGIKHFIVAWVLTIIWFIVITIVSVFICGCKVTMKGAQLEIDEHIDKRVTLIVTNRVTQLKTGPEAREITENGIKQILADYAFEGSAIGFGSIVSWLATFFGVKYLKERKKNKIDNITKET